jgi:predicted ATP-dependent endonuclease of OLD family
MHLSRLFIQNYRSINRLSLEFREGKNIIVGKNNSGKSNIVKAIDLVLGENSPDYYKSDNVTENDFYKGNTKNDIVILAVLSRDPNEPLNYEMINKCYGYHIYGECDWVYDDTERKKVPTNINPKRMKLEEQNENTLLSHCKEIFEINFDEVKTVYINPKLKNQMSFKTQLDDKYEFAYLFYATFDESKKTIQKDLRFLYRESDKHNWVLASRASVRNELLQSAIIPSFRDPQNQLRANNYTWYGKLLQNYIDSNNPKLKAAFEEVKTVSSEVFSKLEKRISDSRVQVAFPDTKISFQFNPDTKQEIYKSALIYVDDGFNSLLQDKGSGIQSAVIIGLFDFYVRNISHVSSSLLAIEEPELYLHPHGRRVISNRLEDFLDGGKNQVIVTTHSSEFITSTEKDLNIILVRKIGGKTLAQSTFFKNPKDKRLLLKGQNTEMFFADYVILVEGSEKYIFDVISRGFGLRNKDLGENWLDDKNVSIISVSGKGEFLKYCNKLDELRIPWMVLADFDFIRRCLSEFLSGRKADSGFIDQINAVKSEISMALTNNNSYKNISIIPAKFHTKIKKLVSDLITYNVFIFSGELEDFYTSKSNLISAGLEKEEKAICIASEIEINKESDYLILDEIEKALSILSEKIKLTEDKAKLVDEAGIVEVPNNDEVEEEIPF